MARFHNSDIVDGPPKTKADEKHSPDEKNATEKKASGYYLGLEAGNEGVCVSVRKEIDGKQYADAPTLASARVEQLYAILCPSPPPTK